MRVRVHFQKLVERVRMLPPLPAAIVFPCERDALQLALSGAFAGYLAPTLVGPKRRIRDEAARSGLDISRLPIVDTPDDPSQAARQAVELARERKVAALVKGTLTDRELLMPVAAPDSGLRTEHRLSHVSFLDVPGQTHWMLLADAQLNIAPNLAAKKDILANTLALALALGLPGPRVALLAAVDGLSAAFPSTADAAALKAMAGSGMFGTAIVEGPMTPDVALSAEVARALGLTSEVAGRADVLIAPDMEAATMVLRTLTGLTGGLAAGLVVGARVPIVAPARTDTMETRMASCVLASLAVNGVRDAVREAPEAPSRAAA